MSANMSVSINFYKAKFLCISYIKLLLSIIFIFVLSDKISVFIPLINGKNQRYKH